MRVVVRGSEPTEIARRNAPLCVSCRSVGSRHDPRLNARFEAARAPRGPSAIPEIGTLHSIHNHNLHSIQIRQTWRGLDHRPRRVPTMILRRLARSVVPTHASRAYGAVPAVPEGRVSEFVVPEHLRQFVSLTLRMDAGRCMVIGKPRYQYPIAVVPTPKEVAPLLTAIRSCEARPFRIISYADEAGSVFNCSVG